MNYNFLKTLLVVFSVVALIACDKDYITVGGDIIGGENFNSIPGEEFDIALYNQKTGSVQSNNMPINQIGVYNNPFFGKTEANFVTQLELTEVDPTFGENIVIDSVVMNVPYVSKIKTNSDGKTEYELLDMNGAGSVDLSVYRNDYELLSLNPDDNFQTSARYYSNQNAIFDNAKLGLDAVNNYGDYRLNDRYNPAKPEQYEHENISFLPSKKDIVFYKFEPRKVGTPYVITYDKTSTIESRIAPAMRLRLNSDYFLNKVVKASRDKLKTNIAFKKYFKGLYLKVKEKSAGIGTMSSLDFKKGSVTIYYTEDKIVKNSSGVEIGNDRPRKTLVMNMTGNSLNLYNFTASSAYSNFNSQDPLPQNLYLKGGEGSFAYIDLFTNAAKLAELKAKNAFVTEASLTFTVNDAIMGAAPHPLRLYLYDVENETVISDYNFDTTANPSDLKTNKSIFGGILKEEKTNDVVTKRYYKIRITDFVNKILKGTQKNVRLGLAVCENINDPNMSFVETKIDYQNLSGDSKETKKIPRSSVYNPLGTVLYGATGDNNRVKFVINYASKK
jgi:hypothetical protein